MAGTRTPSFATRAILVAASVHASSLSPWAGTAAEPLPRTATQEAATAQAEDPGHEAAARAAALAWLAHVDAGRYGESWGEASSYFRGQVTEAAWQRSAAAARGPLGALKTRTFAKATPATSLPGVPDGQYVVLEFRSSFANKAEAVETVTPRLENGVWRVSGYYIH